MSDASRTPDLKNRLDEMSDAKRALLARRLAERAAQRDGIAARANADVAPLSAAQEEIWLLEQLAPGLTAYNLASAFRVRGAFDESAFQRALDLVVSRHEVLRTTFATTEGGAQQRIGKARAVDVRIHESEPTGESDAQEKLREWAATPFDLSNDLMLRAGIARLSASDRFVFVMTHHLATDGVTRGVLFEEIASAYSSFANGATPDLQPARVPFGDYAEWERSAPTVQRLSSQLEFWREALRDAPDALELPLDHARTPAQSFVAGKSTRVLSLANLAALNEAAARQNASPFMVLMSAFSALLARYSGQDDLIVGVPTAGRARSEVARAVGPYANTIAIRARLSEQQTFAQLTSSLRESTLQAFENQEIPYARVVSALRKAGQASQSPLFRVMFAMQNHGASSLSFSGAQTEPIGVDNGSTKFDLTMLVSEREDGLRMTLEYRADLFEQDTVDRMLAHFERLLLGGMQSPDTPVVRLPLMDAAEEKQVRYEWNATAENYPDVSLTQLLEEQRLKTPGAPALTFEAQTLSYAELHARVDVLAQSLVKAGVHTGVLVAIAAERSIELVVALLAVLKAGGAYVPFDPEYPLDRLSYMLEDAAPQVLLVQRAVIASLPAFAGPTLVLDEPDSWPRGDASALPVMAPTDAAYMIYTSGSTGRPKGALNAHRGIVNRLLWMQQQYQLSSADVVLQKTPYSFDVSVWEFFWPLITGARLVVARAGGHRDPRYLLELIASEGVTTLHFVPSMLRAFLASTSTTDAQTAKKLRHMMCSGEALSADLVAGTRALFPSIGMHNLYGPTECAVDVTHWTCTANDELPGANVPIGQPVANTQLYVLDSVGQLLPAGVPGELYLAGTQVGMGYHRRPELTAEKFVADPFSSVAGARMYRTGDRARWRSNGVMEYLGRLDDQIKLRGFRIELGEIGSAMQRHPALSDAVAVLREERDGIVVGYCVPDEVEAGPLLNLLKKQEEAGDEAISTHELPNGLTVLHRNRGETDFLYKEIFEGEGYLRHGLTIGDGDVVFDVGANIGLFTVFAGVHARNTRVFAFEPIPPVYATLKGNAEVYGVGGRVYNCGLGGQAETVSFTYYPHNTVLSGRFADAAAERAVVERYLANDEAAKQSEASLKELLDENLESETFECSIRTLSDIFAQEKLDRIDLLKIDVEKAEWDVLCGIDDATWPLIRQAVIEVHDESGRLQRVLDLLQGHGFTCVAEEESMLAGTGLYAVYARRLNAPASAPATGVLPWSSKTRLSGAITAMLLQQLPGYMVPSDIVLLPSLPLTASGKLNRRALPAPHFEDKQSAEPPLGAIEEVIASVWRQALQIPFVARSSNFFALGGHSLTMTTVLAAMAKLFRMQLPLRVAFESPTVAGMAAALSAREAKPGQVLKIATIVSKLQAAAPAGATEKA